jgi:formylglycine-generating enzyme
MVAVDDRFCIDRWEASLVDKRTRTSLSPYYPPDRRESSRIVEHWESERLRVGNEQAREVTLPPLPAFQRARQPDPMAVSKRGMTPNGYLSKIVAKRACENADKRLCQYDEWREACMGEAKRQFPYGDKYVAGACNIFRALHPAAVLHDNPAIGHLDPRLNLVRDKDDPLLRKTGATPRCKSDWGDDAIYDMNGNLDEWVEDEKPRFVGGFFSRSKKDGCDSSVGSHPETHFDYTTGVRCCLTPER